MWRQTVLPKRTTRWQSSWPPTRNGSSPTWNTTLAGDVAVDTVANLFSLDQDGRLTGSQVEVTLTSTDEAGTRHTFQASLDLTFDQYGTTSVPPLDVGGRELRT